MSLKLSGLFCTPAVVHTSCFDYVLKATAWKMKTAYMFAMLVIWCKMQRKKLLQITVSLRKWIQLKVYSHPVKNVWISFLILILIFWWIQLAVWEATKKFIKILSLILKISGKENLYDGFDMLYVPMRSWAIVQIE